MQKGLGFGASGFGVGVQGTGVWIRHNSRLEAFCTAPPRCGPCEMIAQPSMPAHLGPKGPSTKVVGT